MDFTFTFTKKNKSAISCLQINTTKEQQKRKRVPKIIPFPHILSQNSLGSTPAPHTVEKGGGGQSQTEKNKKQQKKSPKGNSSPHAVVAKHPRGEEGTRTSKTQTPKQKTQKIQVK
jgi:hypothetical protein